MNARLTEEQIRNIPINEDGEPLIPDSQEPIPQEYIWLLDAQLAKVAPIYQARIEAEREKVLREVGELLQGRIIKPDNDSLTRFDPFAQITQSEIESFKSGKMPGESLE